MGNDSPIGVFDSGVGGLSVLSEMVKILPNESFIYFGDTLRAPYGVKSPATIIRYAKEICEFLVSKNVKCIVTACNTESAYALSDMKSWLDFPVMGVIDSAVNEAIIQTKNLKIGVIATNATVNSKAYSRAINSCNKDIFVIEKACPEFVVNIESNNINNTEFEKILYKNLSPLLEVGIDTLILGCTHYPLIEDKIKMVVGDNIKLINPAKNTALKLKKVLKDNSLEATSDTRRNQYYASKKTNFMEELVNNIEQKNVDIKIRILGN